MLKVILLLAVFVAFATSVPYSCSLQYGTYTSNEPFLGYMNDTATIDGKIARTSYIVQWYQNWGDGSGQWSNVLHFLNIALNFKSASAPQNHIALLTWQPWGPKFTQTPAEYPLSDIASGKFDAYIDTWVQGIKNLNYSVYLRPLHEMDGTWYPWGQVSANSNTPAKYIAAWQHIYSRFSAVSGGTKNVKFVWCPNNSNNGIDQTTLYPGDAYVDWICLDAYASSPSYSFKQTITTNCNPPNVYQRLTNMTKSNNTKPMMIAEFGVKEGAAGSTPTKQQWFSQLNTDLPTLPRIQALVYFNSQDYNYSTSTGSIAGAKAAFGGCTGAVAKVDNVDNALSASSSPSSGSAISSWVDYLLFK